MRIDEYADLDATALAAVIAAGDVTAEEVATLAAEAINAVSELNAVCVGPFEKPLDHAADGVLAGVPFAIKDLVIHARGVPTRMGTRLLGDGIAPPADTSPRPGRLSSASSSRVQAAKAGIPSKFTV